MKIELMNRFVSFHEWACGLHVHGSKGTLVAFAGTAWNWGFSHGPSRDGKAHVFGLCIGPLTLGGYIG